MGPCAWIEVFNPSDDSSYKVGLKHQGIEFLLSDKIGLKH